MMVEQVVHPMTNHQLEQLKEHIPEVCEILTVRGEETKRKKELQLEDKKRIDVGPTRNGNNLSKQRKSLSKNSHNQDYRLKCEFCGKFDSKFGEEDMKDLHYLEG